MDEQSQRNKVDNDLLGNKYGIDVSQLITQYEADASIYDILKTYPSLCCLLGRTEPATDSDGSRVVDSRPDSKQRPICFLKSGSGMFGLTDPEDAMRWKGIFNHVMGSSRQVYYIAERLKNISPSQSAQFVQRGYDVSSLSDLNPGFLRDFMFVSHAGRRQADEYKWHNLRDECHTSGDSGSNTVRLLQSLKADNRFLDLLRVETHADILAQPHDDGYIFPDIIDNLLTYCDWTFSQAPVNLTERFKDFSEAKKLPEPILNTFYACGHFFENAIKEIIDPDIFEQMIKAGPYEWEIQIRNAYCRPSGISLHDAFPGYVAQLQLGSGTY